MDFFKIFLYVSLSLTFLIPIIESNASTTFPEQFIFGGSSAYFPESYFEHDSYALNLEGVIYNSDGKTLDATLVLHGKTGFEGNNTLSYGMLIDSDTNFDTGIGGFDYRYMVQWKNNTWFEIYEKLPTFGTTPKNLSPPHEIENVFLPEVQIQKQLRSTVDLKLDLEKIGSPDVYSIVFFTEGKLSGDTSLVQDILSRAVIPPLDFEVTTYPFPLSFESSTEKSASIFVDTTFTENAEIFYNIYSDSDDVSIKEISSNSVFLQNGKAEIPILLKDVGHDDLQIHKLFVDLNPWYEVNPQTRNVERGGEIFESYYYRNSQKSETFTLLWTSLPQPGFDWNLSIQLGLFFGTLVMIGVGIATYVKNAESANFARKDRHKIQLLPVYELMPALISKVDHYSKQLMLNYPENEDDQSLVAASPVELHTQRNMHLLVFDGTIPFYDSALKHLSSYRELNHKWKELDKIITQYNNKVDNLKNMIKEECLKTIHEKLSTFRDADGNSGSIFYIQAISFEAFNVLADAMHGHEPRTSPVQDKFQLSENEYDYHAYLSSTLFNSSEPLPSKINEILGCVLVDNLKKEYESLMELESLSKYHLDAFRIDMKAFVKDLKLGIPIKGKCKLESSSFFFRWRK